MLGAKHVLGATATMLVLAGQLLAAPLAGTWKIEGDVQGYPIRETCTLTGPDTALTGTCVGERSYAATAMRKDDTVILKHAGVYQGQDLTLTFTGKLQGNSTLTGSIDVQPLNYDGAFTATRSDDAPTKP